MDYRLGIRNAPGNPLRICQLYPSESKIVVLWQSNQFGQDVYKWIPPTSLEAQSIATKEFTERIAADIELRATLSKEAGIETSGSLMRSVTRARRERRSSDKLLFP
jgi:hypothetical protein